MSDPYIGKMVLYRLTFDQADDCNRRRQDKYNNLEKIKADRLGYQAHHGNSAVAGYYPMVITRVYGTKGDVNGQVFLDGNDTLWVTSRPPGDGHGQWQDIPEENVSHEIARAGPKRKKAKQ